MPEYSQDYENPTSEPEAENPEAEDTEENESTALLPKSVLGGKTFKPGEEVVLEIVHVYEDEVEVKYAKEKPEGETEPEEETEDMMGGGPNMMEAQSNLDKLAV